MSYGAGAGASSSSLSSTTFLPLRLLGGSSTFFGAGLGGAPPFGPKKDRMSAGIVNWCCSNVEACDDLTAMGFVRSLKRLVVVLLPKESGMLVNGRCQLLRSCLAFEEACS